MTGQSLKLSIAASGSRGASSQRFLRSSTGRATRWSITPKAAAWVYHLFGTSLKPTEERCRWKARPEKAASLLCRCRSQRPRNERGIAEPRERNHETQDELYSTTEQ